MTRKENRALNLKTYILHTMSLDEWDALPLSKKRDFLRDTAHVPKGDIAETERWGLLKRNALGGTLTWDEYEKLGMYRKDYPKSRAYSEMVRKESKGLTELEGDLHGYERGWRTPEGYRIYEYVESEDLPKPAPGTIPIKKGDVVYNVHNLNDMPIFFNRRSLAEALEDIKEYASAPKHVVTKYKGEDVKLRTAGFYADPNLIDPEIRDLILELNSEGYETFACCYKDGFIGFVGKLDDVARASVKRIMEGFGLRNIRFRYAPGHAGGGVADSTRANFDK